MREKSRFVAALLAGTILAGTSGSAMAQDKPSADTGTPAASASEISSGPDEIVVTAQKRSENLQNVPISIQAIGTQKLEQLNITNFNEFTRQLPSVSFQTTQPGVTTVYIRGAASGGDGNHSGSLPSVGVYLDEQPITTIGGNLDVHIYDIARIEALSGPQGTLYGASSESGTLRIITNKPDTSSTYGGIDVEGNKVTKGSQGGKIEGFINHPLSENAAIRIVGFYEHDAGFIDNVPGTRTFLGASDGAGGFNPGITINNDDFVKKNYNDVDVWGGRAALKIDLDDNWTATATAFGQDQKNHGAFGTDGSVGDLKVQHFRPEYNHDRFIQGALTIEGKIGNWDLTYSGAYLKRKINSSSDYTDYAEAYDAMYASYGGLANYFYYQDNAGNQIVPVQRIVGTDKFNKLSQELRISSPADKPFRVVGGLFYQRQYHNIRQDYQVPGLADDLSVNGYPGTLWLTQQHRLDKDYAAFGEASYDILPNLTVTGGVRYYKFDNSLIGFFGFGRNPDGPPYNGAGSSRTGVAGCFNTDGTTVRDNPGGTLVPADEAGAPCTNLGVPVDGKVKPRRAKDDGFIHKLNLTWKVDPDHMVYATWSRGFRPGGINRRGSLEPYKPDYLTNYEVGWKTSWFDRKFRWNGAIFQEDWKAFQYSFLGANSFTEIHNGPNARIRGIESDISVYPVSGLTLTASGAYLDGKLRGNLCAIDDPSFACTDTDNSIVAPKGTRLPVTPKFKASGIARYEWALGAGKAHLQGLWTHSSSASSALRIGVSTDDAPVRLHAYDLVDLAVGYDWGNITTELFASNVFDKRAQLSSSQECGSCSQRSYYYVYRPQTFGVRMGYRF
ncbi:TonB-dependent receptor [Sphingomonas crusticola]|uniref:TonB-dependent receptor n=1 Tax=Sphingomonas crusticola TaxID=1697973 RepID=UPI000E27B079|nr:TonB-dependent receptor [Sphingomonas crusticola]